MLVALSSLQPERAYAHGSDEESIDEIYAIKAGAVADLNAAVAAAAAGFETAGTEDAARAVRNNALETLEAVYWSAAADMWWVAEEAHWVDPVGAAFWDAIGALEGRALQAASEVGSLYDAWVAAQSGPDPAEVIARIDQKLSNGLNKLTGIVAEYEEELEEAATKSAAREARDEALAAIEERVSITTRRLDEQLALLPDDPAVQAAHEAAISDLHGGAAAATSSVQDGYSEWVAEHPSPTTTTVPPATTTTTTKPPPTTTTTAPPPTTTTTTTRPPTTTTTVIPTTTSTLPPTTTTVPPTTTTLAPAAQLPPTDPPGMSTYMAELPAPVVLSATAEASAQLSEASPMVMVGLVRRVVDSQLPAGVSVVAAGPLVVLGLIIDAIRAAGALMVVPWLVLGIYMAGLLRPRRTPLGLKGSAGSS
jgi:hypothetical protein